MVTLAVWGRSCRSTVTTARGVILKPDKVDTEDADEVVEAVAKTVAETDEPAGCHDPAASDRAVNAADNARRGDATFAVGSNAKH
jgi:predicted NBD/HSP70 family sugar kinase